MNINGVKRNLEVFRIPLDLLYYNDQNDRIATSIDSYNRNHDKALNPGKNEEYNKVGLTPQQNQEINLNQPLNQNEMVKYVKLSLLRVFFHIFCVFLK